MVHFSKSTSSDVNRLGYGQEERLYMLIEECGEVIQAATKVLRHGWYSTDPHGNPDWQNIDQLRREITDLRAVIHMLTIEGELVPEEVERDKVLQRLVKKLSYTHKQANIKETLKG
jgi:NTP pyrophosphatase (non-canonical NTP hydrolase)